jgi:hypothetical protein
MLLAALLGSTVLWIQTPSYSADSASPDSLVRALYDVISGPSGQKRNWERMRNLFEPGATMLAVFGSGSKVVKRPLTVDDYIKVAGPNLEGNGWYEKEIARRLEVFGAIGSAWSTYESRTKNGQEKPTARGINCFQITFDGTRWWIHSLTWQAEDTNLILPTKYLKSGGKD